MFITDPGPGSGFFAIPDPGAKKAPDQRSGSESTILVSRVAPGSCSRSKSESTVLNILFFSGLNLKRVRTLWCGQLGCSRTKCRTFLAPFSPGQNSRRSSRKLSRWIPSLTRSNFSKIVRRTSYQISWRPSQGMLVTVER